MWIVTACDFCPDGQVSADEGSGLTLNPNITPE